MAMFPLHHEFPCKDHVFQNGTSTRQSRGELLFDSNGSRRFSSGRTLPCPAFDVLMKAEVTSSSTNGVKWTKSHIRSVPRGKLCVVRASSETKTIKKRLKLLDSYFGKLQSDDEKPSISTTGDDIDREAEVSAEEELKSLSAYLDKQQKDAMVKPVSGLVASKLRKADIESKNRPFQQLGDDDDQSEDTLSFYAVSILASINVGVCLFEAASPVRNNDMGLLSLPLLYGAKINDLIVAGEWWRLVTPMFLHSGIPHVALSSWALLTFGPKVCRDYGLFTFCLIYILGGVSGNFMSFLHTPDPTVGGTGPAFAFIGAWLVDQSQNKEMIKRDEYDDLFQKAIIMSGLGLILSHFGPIDDWTNIGALVTGIVYGFFTCPVFQLGRGSERQEGIVTVGPEKPNSADPCKSFLVFLVFVALLVTSVILLGDGPLDFPTYDDVVYSLI
uniref:Rhomboid protease GluP n=2 Tax=Noccaea caerulescens TaxID=107243 RepID=A0A1J3II79_NOCCA